MRINFKKLSVILPALLLFTSACDLDVPVREMVEAKSGIEEAYKYKADLYSSEELKNAEMKLLQSNEFIKNEKADDAKKAAEESKARSDAALNKALPIYSADIIKTAEKSYTEAEKLFAARFSPEKFREAEEKLSLSREAYSEPDYRKSLELSSAAIAFADQAKAESLGNSSALQSEINSLITRLADIKRSSISDAAADQIRGADAAIESAEKHLTENDFRETVASIAAAREEIASAERIVEANTIYAQITKLRAEINSSLADERNPSVRGDLDKASLALNRAETLIEQPDFPASKTAVAEAEKLIVESKIRSKEALLLARIAAARADMKNTEAMDKESAHEKNLGIAASLLEESSNELKNRRFERSEEAVDEAETIIAAVKNSIERAAKEIAVESKAGEETTEKTAVTEEKSFEEKPAEEEKIYVVQWRKKDTDCLWRISLAVYNDASFWPAIYIANKDQIKDPDLIFPGQKFKIPPKPDKRPEFKRTRDREAVKPNR